MISLNEAYARVRGFLKTQQSAMYNDFIQPVENSFNTVIGRIKNSDLKQFKNEQTYEKVIDFSTRALLFGVGARYCYKPIYNYGRACGGYLGSICGFFIAYVGFRFIDKSVNRFIALSSCLYQGGDLFLRGESPLQTRLGGILLAVTSLYMLNYPKTTQETPTKPHQYESLNLAEFLSRHLKNGFAHFKGNGTAPPSSGLQPPETPT